jgi:transcriptional regulator with XRE-family HTH domain
MTLDLASFGRAIASARKVKQLSQKELSALIRKEDGEPITPQYLNDIEHDRRSPSGDHLVKQFAKVLGIDINVLFSTIGMLSEEDRRLVKRATPEQINEAFVAFRKELRK